MRKKIGLMFILIMMIVSAGTIVKAAYCSSCGKSTGVFNKVTSAGASGHYTLACDECESPVGKTQSHSYGYYINDSGTGKHKRTCSDCGYVERTSHSWDDNYVKKDDSTHYTQQCSKCSTKQGSEAHTYEWDENTDNVTKTTHGMMCTRCTATTTQGHTNTTTEYEEANDTCLLYYNCSTCGTYLVSYEDHKYGSWSNDGLGKTHSRTCSNCGHVQSESHNYGSWKEYDSNYHHMECSECDSYYSGSHSGGTATCSSLAMCSYCNATYGSYGNHDWDNGTVTTSPTCKETGIRTYRCNYNSSHTYTETIPANGHTPETNWETNDDQHYKRCTDCNDIVESGNHADNNSDGKCDTCGYIMQRDATITLSPSPTLTLEYGTKDNFTYTYDGDGTLSAISGSTTIARVSLNTSNKTITVTPVKVGETTLTLSAGETNRFFAASATATIKVTYGKITLPSSVSFVYNGKTQNYPSLGDGCTITGETSATNVGTYTVSLSLDSNHEWSDGTRTNKTATWSITQKSINSSDITKTVNPSSYTYDGNAKVPTVTVRDTSRNVNLVAGTDYDITGYGENTKAGNPIITIVGKGNYKDTTTATFEIKPKNLNSSDIVATLSETKYEYDKTAKKPTVTIKDGEKVLTENADYKVTYTNNVEVGTATVTIQGSGNYTGTIIKTFIIEDTTPPTVPVITAKYNSSTGNTYNSGVWTNQNVYISLLSTDLSGIAKYQYQEGGTSGTWRDMPTGGARIWSSTIDKTVYFRAMDKHGNYSGTSNITIRIDKIMPTLGTIKATLRIENGANYTWGTNTDKSIYIKIDNIGSDLGGSGLKETTYKVEKIDPDTNSLIETIKEKETAVTTLVKNGTYRIVVTTEDNAGNRIESQAYIAKIEKYFVNTVKINNIYDIGSGIKEIEIKAVKEGETTPQYENVLKTNEPNINQRIKLTDGTFTITVKIRDKVGNEKTLTQTLTNTVY